MWTPSYTQMVQYVLEKENTELIREETDNSLRITLNCALDPALYDYPLTVKAELPDEWTDVTVDGACGSFVKVEEGHRYLVADAKPGTTLTIHRT